VTKKWNVLGEVRVGVFAQRAIPRGEELTYDYDFEWYGGEKVRCQCGSAQCIGFLGAKSKRFKEDLVLWEDDDDRWAVLESFMHMFCCVGAGPRVYFY
jgi:hypothetical protein